MKYAWYQMDELKNIGYNLEGLKNLIKDDSYEASQREINSNIVLEFSNHEEVPNKITDIPNFEERVVC